MSGAEFPMDFDNDANREQEEEERPPVFLEKMTADEHKEREKILKDIRGYLISDPNVKLDTRDILPEQINYMTNQELKCIRTNCELEIGRKHKGVASVALVDCAAACVPATTGGQYTLESAKQDKDLLEDIDTLVGQYFGFMPVIGRILLKMSYHLKPAPPLVQTNATNLASDSPDVNTNK